MPPWAETVCDRVGNTLDDDGRLQTRLGQLQGGPHAGSPATDDHAVEIHSANARFYRSYRILT